MQMENFGDVFNLFIFGSGSWFFSTLFCLLYVFKLSKKRVNVSAKWNLKTECDSWNSPETNHYSNWPKVQKTCNIVRSNLKSPLTLFLSAADRMGKMVLAGGAAVGLGALCYYGLGMSNEIGAIEKAVWVTTPSARISCVLMVRTVVETFRSYSLLVWSPCAGSGLSTWRTGSTPPTCTLPVASDWRRCQPLRWAGRQR